MNANQFWGLFSFFWLVFFGVFWRMTSGSDDDFKIVGGLTLGPIGFALAFTLIINALLG